jgi:DNA-binding transcriptional regulator YhcF (GntR family)
MPPKRAASTKPRVYKNLTKEQIKEIVHSKGFRISPSAVAIIYSLRERMSKDEQIDLVRRAMEVMHRTGKMVTVMDKHVECLLDGCCVYVK